MKTVQMLPIKDFNHKAFITAAEELLRSDETLMALKLLDMVPGYFRDNPIPELQALKREVQAKIATASFYATHQGFELTVSDEDCLKFSGTLRNQLISHDTILCNNNKKSPSIFDMGPGEAALPIVLSRQDLQFYYDQIYVNEPTRVATAHRFEDLEVPKDIYVPTIFVATEVIEHLHYEEEIRAEMERACGLADIIHISTPLYTYNPNMDHWKNIGWLGHLRTYTPVDFTGVVRRMFPEYEMAYYQSQVQHARLYNPKSKFEFLKQHIEVK